MNRFLVTSLVVAIASGCASSSPPPSSTPATAASAASVGPSVAPSMATMVAPTAVPTIAATDRPTPSATPQSTPFPIAAFASLSEEPVPEDVAARFEDALANTEGGGIATTVITSYGTWSGAAGTADGVHDVAVDAQFGIASATKPIVAAQLMQLAETGEISLDAPATDYLPADFSFDTNGATIRELMSHRSGIPGWYTDTIEEQIAEDRLRAWEADEVLALVPSARRPVGSFEYADTNYNLLALVIEHVRQRPLADVLRDGVLRVDGTERLIYQPAEAPTDPMAMPGGESRDALEQGGGYLPSLSEVSAAAAAGAAASDSISLARWWRAFCAGEIVSQASLTEMSTLDRNDELPVPYGLGLTDIAGGFAHSVGHYGSDFGYKHASGCVTGESPFVVVVLTNGSVDDFFGLPVPLIRAALSQ